MRDDEVQFRGSSSPGIFKQIGGVAKAAWSALTDSDAVKDLATLLEIDTRGEVPENWESVKQMVNATELAQEVVASILSSHYYYLEQKDLNFRDKFVSEFLYQVLSNLKTRKDGDIENQLKVIQAHLH